MSPEPIATGRTADVFADSPGRIRRIYRDGRDATAEAALMRHLAAHGYPVPTVHDAAGPTLVMDAITGPTLAADAIARPERLPAAAAILRDLHDRLAVVPPPAGLESPFGDGGSVLHLDLHPFNVLLGPDGPVVIDWCTAVRGPSAADRAYTWVVMSTATKPYPDLPDDLYARARQAFTDALLDGADDPARAWIAAAARRRLVDPFLLPAERPPLERLGRVTMR